MAHNEIDVCAAIADTTDRRDLRTGGRPGRLDLADRCVIGRTPVRQAMNRLAGPESAACNRRRDRTIAVLNSNQARAHSERHEHFAEVTWRQTGMHAPPAEVETLRWMVAEGWMISARPRALARASRRFRRRSHRSTHRSYLNDGLQTMRRTLALLSGNTLAVREHDLRLPNEHRAIIKTIASRDEAETVASAEAAASSPALIACRARFEPQTGSGAQTQPKDIR